MKSIIALVLLLPLLTQNGFVSLSGKTTPIVQDGKTEYVIVRAADSNIAMAATANNLSKTIKSKTGAAISVVKDSEKEKAGARGSREILLGVTNRTKKDTLPALDAQDFHIRENDGALLIYAGSDAAYRTAERYLSETFMTDGNFIIPDKYEYTYFQTYDIEEIILPGGKIDSHTLCYVGDYAKETAENFASEILSLTGKKLSVSTLETATEPYICFGDSGYTTTSVDWRVVSEKGNIFISSQNGMGLDKACEALKQDLFNGGKKVAVESIEKSGKVVADNEFSEFMNLRTPLSNTYKKLTQDKELNVVFFGGSVTNGYTEDGTPEYSWRQLTCNWLEKNFPLAKINHLPSAIGGTGSQLGAFRVGRDVIAHDPDLVFVEFAINDSYSLYKSMEETMETFEAAIRQIRKSCPDCDIVTLFITDSIQITHPTYTQTEAHDKISEIYGIDSVNLGAGFAKKTGLKSPIDPKWKTYFQDNVHLTIAGNAVYFDVLEEYLADRLIFNAPTQAPAPHALPAAQTAFADSEFQYILAKDLEVSDSTGYKLSTEVFSYMLSDIYYGYYTPQKKENRLEFTFTGTELQLFMDCPRNTKFHYTLDGESATYTHSVGLFFPAKFISGLEYGEHKISITIDNTSGDVRIGAFLIR